jgi:hypothetical protein
LYFFLDRACCWIETLTISSENQLVFTEGNQSLL